jgi:hypothetical protein
MTRNVDTMASWGGAANLVFPNPVQRAVHHSCRRDSAGESSRHHPHRRSPSDGSQPISLSRPSPMPLITARISTLAGLVLLTLGAGIFGCGATRCGRDSGDRGLLLLFELTPGSESPATHAHPPSHPHPRKQRVLSLAGFPCALHHPGVLRVNAQPQSTPAFSPDHSPALSPATPAQRYRIQQES